MGKRKNNKKKKGGLRKNHTFILIGFGCLIAIFFLSFELLSRFPNKSVCANSISCIKDLSGKFSPEKNSFFLGKKIDAPQKPQEFISQYNVLGQTSDQKRIFVDLSKQKLYAYEGDKKVFEFFVSTGKWGRTPTGDFKIWIKLLYTRMEGGSGNDYYNLPNVPYTMFYYNDEVSKSRGFSIHGAYWHNNFGHPMSHGCVNMRPEDAGKIYYWVSPLSDGRITYATSEDPGTLITVFGEPPEY